MNTSGKYSRPYQYQWENIGNTLLGMSPLFYLVLTTHNTAGCVSSLSLLKLTPALITATAIAENDDKELYCKHGCEMLGRRAPEQRARSLRIHNEPGLRHGRRYIGRLADIQTAGRGTVSRLLGAMRQPAAVARRGESGALRRAADALETRPPNLTDVCSGRRVDRLDRRRGHASSGTWKSIVRSGFMRKR